LKESEVEGAFAAQVTTSLVKYRPQDAVLFYGSQMGQSSAYSKTYTQLLKDVDNLLTLHPSQQGTPGRPAGDLGPLLRSTLVLLHTAWENYVEQVAVESLNFLLQQLGNDHAQLHRRMKTKLGQSKDPWSLAGSAWQGETRSAVENAVKKLNTPNVANTEDLLDLAIGLEDGLHDISWQNKAPAKIVEEVNEFVHDIRGEIVHKGTVPGDLNKTGVTAWRDFFNKLVLKLDAKISAHLHQATGTAPW